jgi:hypothetical protein
MSYDVQRIKDIQEKLQCTVECIEKSRVAGDAETLEACEYLAASYNEKLAKLLLRGQEDEKQQHAIV